MEECAWPQHTRSDVQGLAEMESHIPELRTTHYAANTYKATGILLLICIV